MADLLQLSPAGLYCPAADLYLDPWQGVPRALITHAHADHARPGSTNYLTHHTGVPVLRARLGAGGARIEGISYGERFFVQGVAFSFHPAGHVPGSAQILVEHAGERWVFSGDYKIENDGVSAPFEPLRCHVFISECTFGLPVFQWQPQQRVLGELHSWWDQNASAGVSSVVFAYSLGKAQRILRHLVPIGRPVVVHSAIARMNAALGVSLPSTVSEDIGDRSSGALVIAPPAVLGSSWLRRFGEYRCAVASGWMSIRGLRRRRGVDCGFVLSDHADFSGLSSAVRATGAERVLLTHGYTAHFARWLREQGYDARPLDAPYNAQDEAEDLSY